MSDIILTENANVIKRWKWKIKCEWECKQKLKENVKLKEENENENKNENENEDEDDIIKILIHLNEYDEETNQNKKNKIIKKIKWSFRWNNWQVKIIWRSNKIDKKSKKSSWLLLCQWFWW